MRNRLPITILYVDGVYGIFTQYAIGFCYINCLTYNVR